MTTYKEIKDKHSKNYNDIMTEHKVFFAFNNNQFDEGKAKIGITDNKDLCSIGAGGYMPKAKADKMTKLLAIENKRYKKELKEAKELKEQAILYELNNHEAFYTGRLDEVINIFKGLYTKEDIKKVYLKNYSLANL